jgi:hypothetical protein
LYDTRLAFAGDKFLPVTQSQHPAMAAESCHFYQMLQIDHGVAVRLGEVQADQLVLQAASEKPSPDSAAWV